MVCYKKIWCLIKKDAENDETSSTLVIDTTVYDLLRFFMDQSLTRHSRDKIFL